MGSHAGTMMAPNLHDSAADPIMGRAFREMATAPDAPSESLGWHRDLTRHPSAQKRPDPSLVASMDPLLADCVYTMLEAQLRASENPALADFIMTRWAEEVDVKRAVFEQTGIAPPHPTERGR